MKGMGIAQKFRDLQIEKVTTSWAQKLKLGISKDFATKITVNLSCQMKWLKTKIKLSVWISHLLSRHLQGSHLCHKVDREMHGSVKQWKKADCRTLSRKEL